jgi:hypothetical protein
VRLLRPRGGKGQDDQLQVIEMVEQVGEGQDAIALDRFHIALGQKPGQPAPAVTVHGIGQYVGRAIDEHQPRAIDQPQVGFALRLFLLRQFGRLAALLLFIDHGGARPFRRIA